MSQAVLASRHHRLSPKLLVILTAASLAVLYLAAANQTTTLGLELNKYQQQLGQLRQEQLSLQAQLATKQALPNLADLAKAEQLVASRDIKYLEPTTVVAAFVK